MTIRLRLTLLYSVILALVLIAFSMMVYTIQSQYQVAYLTQRLTSRTQRAAEIRQAHLSGEDSPHQRLSGGVRPFSDTQVLQVRNVSGEVIQSPEGESDIVLPLSDAGLQAVQNGQPWVETASVEDERFLICSRPVVLEGQVREIVQIAGPLAEQDQSLKALRGNLLVGSGIATLAAFGLGWMLAGITLRPIHRITQTAQAIGTERDFRRRVQYTGPRDELGRLATTFNVMLTQLQEAYGQVEGSLEMLRDFVADVSHELRTPLTTIRGNLALLRDRPIPAEERDDILADTVDETDRLIRLVNDLLKLARAEAGRQLHIQPVLVKPIVLEVCRRARLLDPDRTIACEPLPDVVASADRDALQQVLLILLDNAVKYAKGPITIVTQIRSNESLDRAESAVAISVRDVGPGIESKDLSHLFERFYRGDDARGEPGLGLGLPIARALIEAQSGTLTAESQSGKGSVFTVILPQAELQSEALS